MVVSRKLPVINLMILNRIATVIYFKIETKERDAFNYI